MVMNSNTKYLSDLFLTFEVVPPDCPHLPLLVHITHSVNRLVVTIFFKEFLPRVMMVLMALFLEVVLQPNMYPHRDDLLQLFSVRFDGSHHRKYFLNILRHGEPAF